MLPVRIRCITESNFISVQKIIKVIKYKYADAKSESLDLPYFVYFILYDMKRLHDVKYCKKIENQRNLIVEMIEKKNESPLEGCILLAIDI